MDFAGKRLVKRIIRRLVKVAGPWVNPQRTAFEALPQLIGTRPPAGGSRTILFVNFVRARCGVFQYGARLFETLRSSSRYTFEALDVATLDEIDRAVARGSYAAVIFNYHPYTLSFLGPGAPRRYAAPSIAVMHEMTQAEGDAMGSGFFQHYVMGDPTLVERNPGVWKTGRSIPRHEKEWPLPEVPTFGSLGFSVETKGYANLVKAVQEEFDRAVIRLHIPANDVLDPDGVHARKLAAECRTFIRKPGIRLESTHHFMGHGELLDFFAQNTLNAFLYDPIKIAGISSTPDGALAARRPIAISRSIMFRHLAHLRPSICIEDSSLRQIIANGTAPFDHLLALWSPASLLAEYEDILDRVLSPEGDSFTAAPVESLALPLADARTFDPEELKRDYERPENALQRDADAVRREAAIARLRPRVEDGSHRGIPGVKRLNGILDDAARVRYRASNKDLLELAPDAMATMDPAAGVQHAFVYDSVLRLAPPEGAKLLCVGSHDDPARVALERLGFDVDAIDPAVHGFDLAGFMALPSTRPASRRIVFSTSVLEHVRDDERFVSQIAELLEPGGTAIFTCDFKDPQREGEQVLPGDHRWYTQRDLLERILPAMKGCRLVDRPQWFAPEPDLRFKGYRYTFASFVVRKARDGGSAKGQSS